MSLLLRKRFTVAGLIGLLFIGLGCSQNPREAATAPPDTAVEAAPSDSTDLAPAPAAEEAGAEAEAYEEAGAEAEAYEEAGAEAEAYEEAGAEAEAYEAEPYVKASPTADDVEASPRPNRIVEVFYGTDRKASGHATTTEGYYTGERGELELGVCKVSIPPGHRKGELEEPKWWRLEFRWNPDRHVVVLEIRRQSEEDWLDALRARVAQSEERSAFVFVHGYNVTFHDAARRAAQIAYDLNFQGAPILYSWPSQGTVTGYTADEVNVQRTERHLIHFLDLVAKQSGARVIHLIAHSMGNRAVTAVLQRLAARPEVSGPVFNQIVLVAPDIDAEIFKDDIVPAIRNLGSRVTLYASTNDKALEASKRFHGGYPRAGDLADGVIIVPGLDTIDASDVDTSFLAHSYFAEATSVILDLFHLFVDGKGPENREGLTPISISGGRYWRIVPARLGSGA